jgi:outer membrane protein assembly factor BamB
MNAWRTLGVVLTTLPALFVGRHVAAADWPQFMRCAEHTGDAADETLHFPLGLAARVKLGDAVMTAPAVVAGRAYVVDQMGTAYCVDCRSKRVVWKCTPDGASAMGFNTSSPCVAGGRVYFGTTAGQFHILSAADGALVKTLDVGSPILSAPVWANDSIYFQALDAVLRCVDLNGRQRWQWNHYAQYQEPPEVAKSKERERGHPGSYDRPHYGGGEVAVSGNKIVTSFGWDLVCLEDPAEGPWLVWCNRAPNGRDGSSPMSSSISGEWIYNAGMGADGHLALTRVSLASGEVEKRGGSHREAYPWITPAVRGGAAACRDSSYGKNGIQFFDFETNRPLASWRDDRQSTPIASSHVLTKGHLVATTLRGEVLAIPLDAEPEAKAFRFQTPSGKGIASTPAVVDGEIYFGSDDGYLYVLGPKAETAPPQDDPAAAEDECQPVAADAAAQWPSTYGNAGNTSFHDDPAIEPPLKVRWATRGFGHQLAPCVASGGDLFTVTLNGLITCQEQATGRLRWRQQMPGPEWSTSSGMLAEGVRLFIPRPTFGRMEGAFYCLDQRSGRLLWSAEIGGRYIWERAAPVAAEGLVAFGFGTAAGDGGTAAGTMIQAWDQATGRPAWSVELNVAGNRSGSIGGCTDGKTMYFTAGAGAWQWRREGDKQRGETVAIEARTGKVLWRSQELFGESYPVLADDKLLLSADGLHCLNAADGKLLWKRPAAGYTRFSVGDDFIVMRGYGGHGEKIMLADGKEDPTCRELGGATHACSSVALTKKYALAITVGGLNVRDVRTGELLWQSPGFAPRGCVNAVLADGRVFWPSAASGVVYCWEPAAAQPQSNR